MEWRGVHGEGGAKGGGEPIVTTAEAKPMSSRMVVSVCAACGGNAEHRLASHIEIPTGSCSIVSLPNHSQPLRSFILNSY